MIDLATVPWGELLKGLRHNYSQTEFVRVGSTYFEKDSVLTAIDHLEKMAFVGEKLSPLETMAVEIMLNDLGYKRI